MRFLTLILFFTTSAVIFAQNNVNDSNIDNSEKKKLENKFKALSTFYIDDTGLVVYESQKDVERKELPVAKKESVIKTETVPNNDVIIISESDPEPYMIDVKPEVSRKTEIVSTNKKEVEPPINIYKEEVISKPKENIVIIDKQPIKAPKTKDQPVIIIEDETDTPILVEETDVDQGVKKDTSKKVKPQGSIFDRKRKSQYKNMEEAALAVESLISELKKEQSTLKGSGSMSSRLSRGVTKDLRKNNTVSSNSKSTSVSADIRPADNYNPQSSSTEEDSGLEPSYFINGVQVDKVEVNKLLKSDIINREIRTRNTVTNNPNGEIWYTVKVASQM